MAVQTEEAEIKVKINNKDALLSADELKAKVDALTSSLKKMTEADDPQLYAARLRNLANSKLAYEAQIQVINGGRVALQQFKDEFSAGQRVMTAAVTNNPIKKFTLDARKSWEDLNNTVQKSPVDQSLKSIKSTLSSSAQSSPFFNYLINGYNAAAIAVNNHKEKLVLQKQALKENELAQVSVNLALAENLAAQEAVNIELAANKAAQVLANAAVLEATTLAHAEEAALLSQKLVKEENALATKAATLQEQEALLRVKKERSHWKPKLWLQKQEVLHWVFLKLRWPVPVLVHCWLRLVLW